MIINDVKIFLNLKDDNSKDDILNLIIERAVQFAANYTDRDINDYKLSSIVTAMVCEDYSKLGNEGVSYRNYSNIVENYLPDYSDNIYKMLKMIRKVRCI